MLFNYLRLATARRIARPKLPTASSYTQHCLYPDNISATGAADVALLCVVLTAHGTVGAIVFPYQASIVF